MRHSALSFPFAPIVAAVLVVAISFPSSRVGVAATTDEQTNSKILGDNPKDVSARIDLIQADIKSENYRQAEGLADDGVRLLPNDASLWSARGAAYYNDAVSKRSAGNSGMEELKIAADSYDQALKLDSNSAPANAASASFAQYSLALWQEQRYSQCLPYADKATKVNPKAWQYSMLKGDCESGLQNYKAAIADYRTAQAGDDNTNAMVSSRLSAALGNAQLRSGDESDGLQSMNKAELLDPGAPFAYQALFAYFTSMNPPELSKALDQLLHLAQLQPNDARLQINIGTIYLREQKFDQASAAFSKALQIDPRNGDAQFGFAELAAIQGDFKSTDAAVEKAVAMNPSDSSFYDASIAQLLIATPSPTEKTRAYGTIINAGGAVTWSAPSDRVTYAQKYADAATRADPNDGTAWYWLGITYAREGKKDMASASLRKAREILSSKSCIDVHFVDRANGASCLEYQKMMLAEADNAYAQLNDSNATLISNGKGGGTGKDITTNGDMPH